ncbi:EamA family transporter [Deinococcus sp. Marseille-Q6407]|uniref:EamA family transporter n=1 Tax=Deinococcus sp. Marseille-Q6407 TaxID=2969223 RepID=UPI0021C1F374|nr:EamA family transporter [Deinococcus sp. Marseille-Q6407]
MNRDLLLTALAPLIWGTTYLLTTTFVSELPALLLGTLRILPAGLVLLALSRRLPPPGWWGRITVLAVLRQALFFVLLYGAALHLPGGVAATVGASSAMLVILLAWPLLGQKPTPLNLTLAGAGLAGVALISLSGGEHLSLLGLALPLGFALTNALGTVLFSRWGPPPGARPLDQVAWELTIGGTLLLPFALPAAPALAGVPPGWGALAFMTLVGTALAAILWQRGLNRLPVQQVGLLAPLSPRGEVVASMMRKAAEGEFRSNLHRGGTALPVSLSEEECSTAIQAARVMGLDVAGVNLLRSKNGPVVMEVNSSPGLEGIERSSGVDVADAIIAYLEKRHADREGKRSAGQWNASDTVL